MARPPSQSDVLPDQLDAGPERMPGCSRLPHPPGPRPTFMAARTSSSSATMPHLYAIHAMSRALPSAGGKSREARAGT